MFSVGWVATGLAEQLTGIERLLVDCVRQTAADGRITQTIYAHPGDEWLEDLIGVATIRTRDRRPGEISRAPADPGAGADHDFLHSFGAPLPRTRAFRSYTLHDWGPVTDRELRPLTRVMWSAAMARGIVAAEQVHLYSESVARDAPPGFRDVLARRQLLFGLPAAPTARADEVPVDRDPGLVLSVGSDFPRKRFAHLANSVETTSTLRLTIAGSGTEQHRRPPRVSGLGRVSDAELSQLYRRAQVFALISAYEGFGLPVMEAWLAGCHLVISDAVAVRLPVEIVRDAIIVPVDADATRTGDALAAAAERPAGAARSISGRGVLVDQIRDLAARA